MKTPDDFVSALKATYAELWETLSWLEDGEIEEGRMVNGWSPKALIAHIAFWDDFHTRRLGAACSGAAEHGHTVWPNADNNARARRDASRGWTEVAEDADRSRYRLTEYVAGLTTAQLWQEYLEGNRLVTPAQMLHHLIDHTRQHTSDLHRYCGSMNRWLRPDLRRFLVQQHENLMDSMGGLTEDEISSIRVSGTWTMREVLVHVLTWHEYCCLVLGQWPSPDTEGLSAWAWQEGDTMDKLNERLLMSRRDLDMIGVADSLSTYHRKILKCFDGFSGAELESDGHTWGEVGVLSCFFYEIAVHEAEHAGELWTYRARHPATH